MIGSQVYFKPKLDFNTHQGVAKNQFLIHVVYTQDELYFLLAPQLFIFCPAYLAGEADPFHPVNWPYQMVLVVVFDEGELKDA